VPTYPTRSVPDDHRGERGQPTAKQGIRAADSECESSNELERTVEDDPEWDPQRRERREIAR